MDSSTRVKLAQQGLQTLLWSDTMTETAAYWPATPDRAWFFWRAPAPGSKDEERWHSVTTQGGRYYSTYDTLHEAFANARRVERNLCAIS